MPVKEIEFGNVDSSTLSSITVFVLRQLRNGSFRLSDDKNQTLVVELASAPIKLGYNLYGKVGQCVRLFKPSLVSLPSGNQLKLNSATMVATKSFVPEVDDEGTETEELPELTNFKDVIPGKAKGQTIGSLIA